MTTTNLTSDEREPTIRTGGESLSIFEIMQRYRNDGSCEHVIEDALRRLSLLDSQAALRPTGWQTAQAEEVQTPPPAVTEAGEQEYDETVRCSCGDVTCTSCDVRICPECGHDYVGDTDTSDCKTKPYAPDDPAICGCENVFHEFHYIPPPSTSAAARAAAFREAIAVVVGQPVEHYIYSGAHPMAASTFRDNAVKALEAALVVGRSKSAAAPAAPSPGEPPSNNEAYRTGVLDACRAACAYCADVYSWGDAVRVEGSTRFWHTKQDQYPCEATAIRVTCAAALRTSVEGESE